MAALLAGAGVVVRTARPQLLINRRRTAGYTYEVYDRSGNLVKRYDDINIDPITVGQVNTSAVEVAGGSKSSASFSFDLARVDYGGLDSKARRAHPNARAINFLGFDAYAYAGSYTKERFLIATPVSVVGHVLIVAASVILAPPGLG